ncbi:helix-turn-helix domain-containing protein [Gordonia sputi]
MLKIADVSTRQHGADRPGTFVSISQVAEIYQVHPTTVRRWIMEGRVEAQRVGSRLIRLDLENVYRRLGRPTPGSV